MAETIGSLIDKITIVELRRWHTEEVMLNPSAPVELRHECALRLRVIDEQRNDLAVELSELFAAIAEGRHRPKVYRQLKMYNHDGLRAASSGTRGAVVSPPPDPPSDPNVIPLPRRPHR
jgi:hypothetical protein